MDRNARNEMMRPEGRNGCPWLPDTCPGDTVVRMLRMVVATDIMGLV